MAEEETVVLLTVVDGWSTKYFCMALILNFKATVRQTNGQTVLVNKPRGLSLETCWYNMQPSLGLYTSY